MTKPQDVGWPLIADDGYRCDVPEHRVTIQLRYTEYGTPWKWQGTCCCGWRCLSWYWSDGERGALPMSREHVRLPEHLND